MQNKNILMFIFLEISKRKNKYSHSLEWLYIHCLQHLCLKSFIVNFPSSGIGVNFEALL